MVTRNKTLAAVAAALAMTSAAAFAADPPAGSTGRALSSTDMVHCYGVNTCRGTADCRTTQHECRGQNGCSGQGFKAMEAGACLARGGTIGDIS
jgi:uncharacterized membrane protein